MYTGKKWYNGKKVKQEREIINYTEEEKPWKPWESSISWNEKWNLS